MELRITGKNIELSEEVTRYIERKLGKVSLRLPNVIESKVEIFEEKTRSPQQRFVVQATVNSNGTLLRGEERGEDLFKAVDKVAVVMRQQAMRYKEKLIDRGRGSSLAKGEPDEEIEPPSSLRKVVKVKRFLVKPMYLDEAIDQMELLSHDFFLFFNADSEKLNLLYQRKDGNYGLIEPELG